MLPISRGARCQVYHSEHEHPPHTHTPITNAVPHLLLLQSGILFVFALQAPADVAQAYARAVATVKEERAAAKVQEGQGGGSGGEGGGGLPPGIKVCSVTPDAV